MIKELSFNAQDRLLAVIPLLLQHAKACDMSSWLDVQSDSRPSLCNSEMCVAGWVVFDDLIKAGKEEEATLVEMRNDIDIQEMAYQLLDVEQGIQKIGLFYTECWPAALADLYNAARTSRYNEARAQIMAIAVRKFAENPLSFKQQGGWFSDDGTFLGEARVW